jgi:uncharacterized delta-60 repeat protein
MVGSLSNGSNRDAFVARFRADGTPDLTFGTLGVVTLPSTVDEEALEVVPDERGAWVFGNRIDGELRSRGFVVRLQASGQIDATVGEGGWVFTPDGWDARVASATRLLDGALLLGGYVRGVSGAESWLMRVDADGKPSRSFGTGGTLRVTGEGARGIVSLAPADGGAVWALSFVGPRGRMVLERLESTGSPGASFETALAANAEAGVVPAGLGALVIGLDATSRRCRVQRLDPRLALDTSLGTGGVLELSSLDACHRVQVLAGGGFVVPGVQGTRAAVYRYRADGAPEIAFAKQGVWLSAEGPGRAEARDLVLADGDVLVAAQWGSVLHLWNAR